MNVARACRRACLAASAVVGTASLTAMGVGAAAQTPSGPPPGVVFAGVASATGVFQHTDGQMGLSATSEPVYGSFPDGLGVYTPDTVSARASTYYPGATVVGLPGLIATAGGPSGLPSYPFTTTADNQHPNTAISSPQALGGSGSQASAQASTAVAHAAPDLVSTDAFVSSFNSPGSAKGAASPATVVHVGSSEAHTRQAFGPGGVLVSHAESKVSGIDVAGGLHIASVFATSTTTTAGGATKRHDDNVTVGGATFAGKPVAIDGNGVSVAGSGQGKPLLDQANAALQRALSAAGARVHVVGAQRPPSGLNPRLCTAGEADGVEISFQVNAVSAPGVGNVYFSDVLLGAACTTATVVPATAGPAAPDSGGATAVPTGPTTGPSGGSSPAGAPASGGRAATGGSPATPTGTAGGSGGASPSPSSPSSPGLSLSGGQASAPIQAATRHRGLANELATASTTDWIDGLYLALGLLVLGLGLAVRSLVPPRLPEAG